MNKFESALIGFLIGGTLACLLVPIILNYNKNKNSPNYIVDAWVIEKNDTTHLFSIIVSKTEVENTFGDKSIMFLDKDSTELNFMIKKNK